MSALTSGENESANREQCGSVELGRSSNECIGDFQLTEEAFCSPDFRVTTWARCIDPRFAKLIRRSWLVKVVVMPERSTEQIRELLDSLYRVDSGRIVATLIRLLRTSKARSSYEKALGLTQQEPERQFLQERIRQLK
jgi:hypothetical protein